MKNEIRILDIAKLVICRCNKIQIAITQLKLQKLLYFIEAYYMYCYDKKNLYKEDFFAWTYGPVCKEVYSKYRVFLDLPIEEECELDDSKYDQEVLDSIDTVINYFGRLNATDLIKLTHMSGSPWSRTQKNSNYPINKEETKEWFGKTFLINDK